MILKGNNLLIDLQKDSEVIKYIKLRRNHPGNANLNTICNSYFKVA